MKKRKLRKIVLEIECSKTTCGACHLQGLLICCAFGKETDYTDGYKRLPECLAAEEEYESTKSMLDVLVDEQEYFNKYGKYPDKEVQE